MKTIYFNYYMSVWLLRYPIEELPSFVLAQVMTHFLASLTLKSKARVRVHVGSGIAINRTP